MVGRHHWLDGRESGWTPGVGDGQGGLACCDSRGHKESDTTEQLNWTELNITFVENLPEVPISLRVKNSISNKTPQFVCKAQCFSIVLIFISCYYSYYSTATWPNFGLLRNRSGHFFCLWPFCLYPPPLRKFHFLNKSCFDPTLFVIAISLFFFFSIIKNCYIVYIHI